MQFSLAHVFVQVTLLAIVLATGVALRQPTSPFLIAGWWVVAGVFCLSLWGLMCGFRHDRKEFAVVALMVSVGVLAGVLIFRVLVFADLPF